LPKIDTGFLSSQIELALPKIDTGFLSSQIELALPKYDLKFTKPGIEELLPRFNFYASWMEDAFSSILRSATLAFWSQYKIFETGGHASDFEPLKGGGEVDPLLMELAFMLSEHLGKHGSPTKRQKNEWIARIVGLAAASIFAQHYLEALSSKDAWAQPFLIAVGLGLFNIKDVGKWAKKKTLNLLNKMDFS